MENQNLNNSSVNKKNKDFNTENSQQEANPADYEEGSITKMIEKQTAKIPSGVYLSVAVGSMALSLALALIQGRSKGWANFIGQWVPTILILGLYNKVVKVEGFDRTEAFH
jgi:hypothetical protein